MENMEVDKGEKKKERGRTLKREKLGMVIKMLFRRREIGDH